MNMNEQWAVQGSAQFDVFSEALRQSQGMKIAFGLYTEPIEYEMMRDLVQMIENTYGDPLPNTLDAVLVEDYDFDKDIQVTFSPISANGDPSGVLWRMQRGDEVTFMFESFVIQDKTHLVAELLAGLANNLLNEMFEDPKPEDDQS